MDENSIESISKEAIASTVNYIKKGKELGYSSDYLKNKLNKSGYSISLINEAFIEFEEIEKKRNKIKLEKLAPIIRRNIIFSITILVLVLILSFGIVTFIDREVVCNDQVCFIEKAKKCKNAVYEKDENYAKFLFKSDSSCVVTKEVLSLSPDEPEIMVNLLDKKSLSCEYKENLFDERIVTSLVSGLENCEGGLKDSLYELAIIEHKLFLLEL